MTYPVKTMFKKAFKIILTSLIISLVSLPLFAEEDEDRGLSQTELMSLREIDQLIKQTRYDDALQKLNLYIDKNPESFDSAQIRIQKIMDLRGDYADIYDKVHELLLTDPENDEKLEYYTGLMRKIEKQKDTPLGLFIDEIYVAAQFRINLAKLNRIMEESQELMLSNNYVAAAQKLDEGFSLYLDNFEEDWNTPETAHDIYIPAMNNKEQLETNLTYWEYYSNSFQEAVNRFVRAVSDEDWGEINQSYKHLLSASTDFANYRNSIFNSSQVVNDLFEQCKKIEFEQFGIELTDASYLPFVRLLILGRQNEDNSGLMGILNRQWNNCMANMKEIVQIKIDNYLLALQKAMPNRLFSAEFDPTLSYTIVNNMNQWGELALKTTALTDLLNPDLQKLIYENEKYNKNQIYARDLTNALGNIYHLKDVVYGNVSGDSSTIRPENPAEAELTSPGYTDSLLATLGNVELTNEQRQVMYFDFYGASSKSFEIEKGFTRYCAEIDNFLSNRTSEIYKEVFNYFETADAKYVSESEKKYNEAVRTNGGANRYNDEGEITFTEHYPEKVLALTTELEKEIHAEIAVIDRHLAKISGFEEQYINSKSLRTITEDKAKLENLLGQAVALKEESDNNIQLALRYQKEAENRYTQAERSLKSNDFERARSRLQDAATNYLRALEISFNLKLQTESDALLAALGERISQGENKVVVEEVRELKRNAWDQYYSQNFESASKLLNEAEERWASTNVDTDEEIEYLIRIINTALSMKTGRTLQPSDSLYPEMSQLLSGAGKDYAEGIRLGAKTAAGKEKFQDAKTKLEKVLQVYSYNEEARALNMKIDQQIDPEKFDKEFGQQVAEIQKAYNNKTTTQETYAKLLDLYELNPKYKGLAALKDNIEYQIGIKRRPVDNTDKKDADNLVKQAETLIASAGRDEEKLKAALVPLNKALEKDPNHATAIKLKDDIQLRIGGKAAVVLSAEDENTFQMATTDYLNGNYRSAKSKVDGLLKKKTNQNSAKILKLQKQIEAQLS